MKKLISVALAAMMLVSMIVALSACATGPAAQTGGDFKIGLECGYAPFNWTQTTDANGGVQIQGTNQYAGGYDIEIAKKIAAGLGKKLVVVKTKWDGLIPAVESGTIDAIIAGMSPTADRKVTIDFTDAYYRSELVMIVKKGSKYESATSLQDFAGANITAQQDTFHYTVIDQIQGVKKQPAMADFPTMRVALESGTIDGYVAERPEGISVAAANPDFAMVLFAAGKGFTASDDDVAVAVGLKKGQPDLVEKINTILAGISEADRQQIMTQAVKNQPSEQ